jgi:two-component system NtrC family sensor kinase
MLMFGFDPVLQDGVGVNLLDFIYPEDREIAIKGFAEDLYQRERRQRYDVRAKTNNGREIWVSALATRIEFRGKVAVLLSLRDTTETRRAEEELHRLSDAVRMSTDSIVITDLEGNVVDVNEATLKIQGANSKSDLIGLKSSDFIAPEEQEIALRDLSRLIEEGHVNDIQYHILTRDGKRVLVETNASVMRGRNGEPVGAVAITRDISERKRMEEERQRMEEQLRLAGRLAAVGELAAGVAHELNNPIAAIQGFAQFLTARKGLDETIRKDLDTIYRESQRAAKITQNLLYFARRHEPEKRLISINEVIEKTLELRARPMKVNNIELVVELDSDLPKTLADFHQMQQVFVNIINNAEQAMIEAHGRGRLVLKTQRVSNMIRISFADNGPGISDENMKRIFDPFFTTKEVGKGTGLGLSICYGLVEAHGGHIYAKSKLGQGATFVVEIPIASKAQLVAETALLNPGSRGVKWNKPGEQY